MSYFDLAAGESVEHLKWLGQSRDKDGYKTSSYADPVTIDGVGVDIGATDEPLDGTVQRSDVDLTLFLPPGTVVGSRDKFVVRGETYEAVGIGERLPNFFTGLVFRTEVKVKRSNG